MLFVHVIMHDTLVMLTHSYISLFPWHFPNTNTFKHLTMQHTMYT